LSKSSALLADDKPPDVTAGYQIGSEPVTSATLGHLVTIRFVLLTYRAAGAALVGLAGVRDRPGQTMDWLAGVIRCLGDLIFVANDEEACWWGWTVERRHGGLSRRYRDPSFGLLASCPHCRGLGITPAESLCAKCSGTGRVSTDQPPFPRRG
jgi:hypothetical protein